MNGVFADEYLQAACTELETIEVMEAVIFLIVIMTRMISYKHGDRPLDHVIRNVLVSS